MLLPRTVLLILLITLGGSVLAAAQSLGALEITGRVKIGGKTEKISRKRFYLLKGGLQENRALIDRIKASTPQSRDCFYCSMKASKEYVAWLKAQDCESPYCREITDEDIKAVPEFQAAYQKGLKQFRGKTNIAQKWVTTNIDPNLRDGFYKQRKTLLESILAGVKPLQSSMTDSVSLRASFIDIALAAGDKPTTFLLSNLEPIQFGGKTYVWACETDIGPGKKVVLPLQVPEPGKAVKKCEVIVKDVTPCAGGACTQ